MKSYFFMNIFNDSVSDGIKWIKNTPQQHTKNILYKKYGIGAIRAKPGGRYFMQIITVTTIEAHWLAMARNLLTLGP